MAESKANDQAIPFVTVDDKGVPCVGFRQCGSKKGTTGLNPAAHTWDVPMEIRCATNENLTSWGAPGRRRDCPSSFCCNPHGEGGVRKDDRLADG